MNKQGILMSPEILRQFIHYLAGNAAIAILILAMALHTDKTIPLVIFIALFVIGYVLARRMQKGHQIPLMHALVKHVERANEKSFPGKPAFFLLLGAIIVTTLFDPLIAITGLVLTTYGDTVATLIGKYKGKTELITNRTLEGTLAGIIAASIVLLFYIAPAKAIGIAIVGMLSEYLPVDDNISMPVVTGIAAMLLL